MYPKWMAKWDLTMSGSKEFLRTIYVWKDAKKLTPHTKETYRIYGVAELHAEAFYALLMKFLRDFAASFDTVMRFDGETCIIPWLNAPILKRLDEIGCEKYVGKREVVFFSHGVPHELLDLFGGDVKTWKKNQWIWNELMVDLFPNGALPDGTAAALAVWNERHPCPALQLKIEFRGFPRRCGLPYRYDRLRLTKFCLYAAFPHGSSDADEQAFEGWLATVCSDLGINAEWYVTGNRPESADAFFDWKDEEPWKDTYLMNECVRCPGEALPGLPLSYYPDPVWGGELGIPTELWEVCETLFADRTVTARLSSDDPDAMDRLEEELAHVGCVSVTADTAEIVSNGFAHALREIFETKTDDYEFSRGIFTDDVSVKFFSGSLRRPFWGVQFAFRDPALRERTKDMLRDVCRKHGRKLAETEER